jgi:hypothetical protein
MSKLQSKYSAAVDSVMPALSLTANLSLPMMDSGNGKYCQI